MIVKNSFPLSVKSYPRQNFFFNLLRRGELRRKPKKFFYYLEKKLILIRGYPATPESTAYLKKIIKTINSFPEFNWDFCFEIESNHLNLTAIVLKFENLTIHNVRKKSQTYTIRELFAHFPLVPRNGGTLLTLGSTSLFTTKLPWDYHLVEQEEYFCIHPHVHSICKDSFLTDLVIRNHICAGSEDFSVFYSLASAEQLTEDELVYYFLNMRTFLYTQSTGRPYVHLSNISKRLPPNKKIREIFKNHTLRYETIARDIISHMKHYSGRDFRLGDLINCSFEQGEFYIRNDIKMEMLIMTLMGNFFAEYVDRVFVANIESEVFKGKLSLYYYKMAKLSRERENTFYTKKSLPSRQARSSYLFKGELHSPSFYFHESPYTVGEKEVNILDSFNITEQDFILDPSFVEVFIKQLLVELNEMFVDEDFTSETYSKMKEILIQN